MNGLMTLLTTGLTYIRPVGGTLNVVVSLVRSSY